MENKARHSQRAVKEHCSWQLPAVMHPENANLLLEPSPQGHPRQCCLVPYRIRQLTHPQRGTPLDSQPVAQNSRRCHLRWQGDTYTQRCTYLFHVCSAQSSFALSAGFRNRHRVDGRNESALTGKVINDTSLSTTKQDRQPYDQRVQTSCTCTSNSQDRRHDSSSWRKASSEQWYGLN